jgi:hypothetical protein
MSFDNRANGTEIYGYAAHLRTDGPNRGPALESYDFASVDGGLKSAENPVSFDGDRCVRDDGMGNCVVDRCGNPSNTDVQGDIFLGQPILADIRSSFAPRLISANPFDPLGTCGSGINLAIAGLVTATVNNSNLLGVTDASTAGASSVTTGLEFSIRLDEAGWDGVSPIKIVAFINGQNHDFMSNQVLGGLPAAQGNLADPRVVDFSAIAGNQFITVNPGTCSSGPTTGACCVGTTCSITTPAGCSGSFKGLGTTCQAPGNPTTCCPANFNGLDGVTVQDIFDFLSAWSSNNPSANFNGVDGVTVQDIFDFLSAWSAGCSN